MELEERGDEGSPTQEQEEARRALWRPADRLQRFSGVAAGAALGGAAVVATRSAGVDSAGMTSAYGDPVPVSTEAAQEAYERGADALQAGRLAFEGRIQ